MVYHSAINKADNSSSFILKSLNMYPEIYNISYVWGSANRVQCDHDILWCHYIARTYYKYHDLSIDTTNTRPRMVLPTFEVTSLDGKSFCRLRPQNSFNLSERPHVLCTNQFVEVWGPV